MDISGNVVVAANNAAIHNKQLPVSEDCVTQGAGDTSVVGMVEYSEGMGDLSQDVHSANELDTSTDGSGKKKKPRKPRTPKDPNKPPRDRTAKVKKTRDPMDPNSTDSPGPGRKRGSVGKRRKQYGEEGIEPPGDGSEVEDNKTAGPPVWIWPPPMANPEPHLWRAELGTGVRWLIARL
ncbi:GL25834 [Drosophila persimilis]|uniref:GL25834 n=1 Tax=Drosophila persimilis TaxID=7234 RepID=B4GJN7_DROPE|nr:GL25834 [Drosophila persimilis]